MQKIKLQRRILLIWLAAIAFFTSGIRYFFKNKKVKSKIFLTEDGKLVTLNSDRYTLIDKRIAKEDIHHWIKNK